MATPLVPTTKIQWVYTVSGVPHKLVTLVNATLIGGVWNLLDRDLVTTHTLADAMSGINPAFQAISGSDWDTGITGTLFQLSGIVWNPMSVVTDTITPAGGTGILGSQMTMVLRDINFKQVKVLVMEGTCAVGKHYNSQSAIEAAVGDFAKAFDGTGVTAHKPYLWVVCRSGGHLIGGSPWIGVTTDFNNKLRRRRGLS